MINRRLALLPLLALAGTSLSGCVAVAIPALAGSAMVGSRVDGKTGNEDDAPQVAASPPPAATAAPRPAPVQTPTVTVAPPPGPSAQVAQVQPGTMNTVQIPAVPAVAPAVAVPAPVTAPVAVAAPVAAVPASPATLAPAPAPDALPPRANQAGFAQFIRYGRTVASGAKAGNGVDSAMLSDPIALDGKRRQCAAGEQQVALIDLDPKGSVFAPAANPEKQPGLALGLAVLREAGVVIAWLSDISVNQSGAVRTALEQSGLDPRGEDIISLSRDGEDRKQQRKDNLAGITCIIAIAGDERPDFDERYKYLRSPEAGAGLEPVIGDGWFLIEHVFPENKGQGQ